MSVSFCSPGCILALMPSLSQARPSMRTVLEAWLVHTRKKGLDQQKARCGVRSCWMELERSWGVTDEKKSALKLQEKSW